MIDINLNNYEEIIIDYFDGKLNTSEIEKLMSFLNQYPEIKEEFEHLSVFSTEELEYAEPACSFKKNLKKESLLDNNECSNFDELCIAKIEGDLNLKENKWFDELIVNDLQKEQELVLFKLTKIRPDLSVVYKGKKQLKKNTTKVRKIIITSFSIAASILILLTLYITIPNQEVKLENLVAEKDKSIVYQENDQQTKQNEVIQKSVNEEIANVITTNETTNKNENHHSKVEEKENLKEELVEKLQYDQIAELMPKKIKLKTEKTELKLDTRIQYFPGSVMHNEMNAVSVKSFIAQKVNRFLFNKETSKIELFDIAQAGVNGINRVAGTKMTLERVYDKDGKVDKTEFNSRLIAFSSPAKK